MSTATTSFGEVPIDVLVKRYELEKKRDAKRYEKRMTYLQTDEGKAWNREKAKAYYERNKVKVLAKRKVFYASKKTSESIPVESIPVE
jgi:hypothetical protein